jgi:hypothetical protein
MRDAIEGLLRQPVERNAPFAKAIEQLTSLAAQCQAKMAAPTVAAQAAAIIGSGAPAATLAG